MVAVLEKHEEFNLNLLLLLLSLIWAVIQDQSAASADAKA